MTAGGAPAGRAWAAARALAAALRARGAERVTGRSWRRRRQECPWWCAGGHLCTARLGYPSGEHRSEPLSWRTGYGVLVVTRVQTVAGAPHLEMRASVRLSTDEDVARWQGQHLPVGVDLTIRAVLAPIELTDTGQGQENVVGSRRCGPLLPPAPGGPATRTLAPVAGPPCQPRLQPGLPLKAGAGQESLVEPPTAAVSSPG
jgi:hypothetical protein